MLHSSIVKKMLLCFLLVAFGNLFRVACPVITQRLLDTALNGNLNILQLVFLALVVCTLLMIACDILFELAKVKYTNSVKQFYREGLVSGMLKKRLAEFDSQKQAEYTSIFHNDISMVCTDHYETRLNLFSSMCTILFSVSALASLNGFVLIVVLVNTSLISIGPILFRNQLQHKKEDVSTTLKGLSGKLNDLLGGIHIIKNYLCEQPEKEQIISASRKANKSVIKYEKVQTLANFFSMLIGYSSDLIVLALGVYFILMGKMTVGALLAAIQISNLISNPITTLSYNINTLNAIKPVKKHLDTLMRSDLPNEKQNLVSIKSIEDINLQNVSLTINEHTLLKQITLHIKSGKKYLLVGKSGCGKTTLLKLLSSYYADYSGEILINGKDMRSVDMESYYQAATMIFQDAYIFSWSLEDNITLLGKYPLELSLETLHLLGVDTITKCTAENISTRLSGGEKQRISLARALNRSSSLLLLDESTSALDQHSRNCVEDFLLKLPHTVINVTHHIDPALIEFYDEIIMMEDGKIVEQTSVESLSAAGKESLLHSIKANA